MSNIITARDPDVIAAEINTIKQTVREIAIRASIEIGGKLTEAKTMVNHGEWGKWLEENVEYSQSTANYLMQFYQQYGGNQESMFDNWTNSELFEKLSVSKHIALLSLPFADRKEFAEQHDAEHLSTRQLQKAVQEQLEEERRKHQQTQGELESTQAQLRDTEQNVLDLQQRLAAAKNVDNSYKDQMDKLKEDKKRAEKAESNALAVVKRLEKQLKEAQEQAQAIQSDLDNARKNPEIPESMMEQLRKEAEAQAAEKAAADIQKQLTAANTALEEANAKVQETEEKLVAAQKKLKMADPAIMEFDTLSQKLMSDYNVLDGLRRKITIHDKKVGEKLRQFQIKMVSMWADALGV